MKAIATSYEISVNYTCNNCNSIFTLHNRNIPTTKNREYKCSSCGQSVLVERLDISIEPRQKKHNTNTGRTKFYKALQSYGYTSKEIDDMVLKADIKDFSISQLPVLLKLALSTVEGHNE